jgi:intracellular septation protein
LWFGYFVFISVLNEFIWRNYSWEFWAAFKAFGLMPMTVIYAVPQMYLMRKYRLTGGTPLAALPGENKPLRRADVSAAEAPAE